MHARKYGCSCRGLAITLEPQAGSTAIAADYVAIPASLTANILAGERCASFTIQAKTDLLIEGEEKLILAAKALNFTQTPNQTIKIIDKTSGDIVVEKYTPTTGDASEPGTHGSFRIYFKEPNVVCIRSTDVIFSISGTATNDDYILISPLKATIPANTHDCFIPITVKDNYIIQGSRSIIITLESATMN